MLVRTTLADRDWPFCQTYFGKIELMGKTRDCENDNVSVGCNRWIVRTLDRLAKAIRSQVIDTFDAFVGNVGRETVRFAGKERKNRSFAILERRNVRSEDMNGIATATEKDLHDEMIRGKRLLSSRNLLSVDLDQLFCFYEKANRFRKILFGFAFVDFDTENVGNAKQAL